MKTPVRTMLRQHRLLHKISLRELADRIGVSHSTLHRFEAGKPMDEQGTLRLIAWLFAPEGTAP